MIWAQYNEMTGHLLLEISRYFLNKLKDSGYEQSSKYVEFKGRHERSKFSLMKAIDELREMEQTIDNHIRKRPVLVELPKFLRELIHIKLGIIPATKTPQVVKNIQSCVGEYTRARSAVGV